MFVIKFVDFEFSGNYNDFEYVLSFDSEDLYIFLVDGRVWVVLYD